MYVGLIDQSETLTGMVFWTQSEGKINFITSTIIGLLHLFATVNEKFQICFEISKFSFIIWFRLKFNYQLLISYQNVQEAQD